MGSSESRIRSFSNKKCRINDVGGTTIPKTNFDDHVISIDGVNGAVITFKPVDIVTRESVAAGIVAIDIGGSILWISPLKQQLRVVLMS